ncbi:hypothetical protein [uncultured Fibrella sp.]|uniref:hypothetical protein n=1 Tax=uncultured Fibrella sp. TaxID=1284596 RepID=UPI0035C955A9
MLLSSVLYRSFSLSVMVVGLLSACQTEQAPPVSQQPLLTKEITTRYIAGQKPILASSHAPLIVDGIPYYYVSQFEQAYQYDTQSRLILVKQTNLDDPDGPYQGNESNWYHYVGNTVIQKRSIVSGDNGDTLTLNRLGYAIPTHSVRIMTTYTYDENGYLLRRQSPYEITLRTVDNENVIKQVVQSGATMSSTETTDYVYDVTRPALPDPLALFREGKGSRNLLTSVNTQTLSVWSFPPYTSYSTVKTRYAYEFDDQNRVKQQTIFETDGVGNNSNTLLVKNFIYSN